MSYLKGEIEVLSCSVSYFSLNSQESYRVPLSHSAIVVNLPKWHVETFALEVHT